MSSNLSFPYKSRVSLTVLLRLTVDEEMAMLSKSFIGLIGLHYKNGNVENCACFGFSFNTIVKSMSKNMFR